ncbi:MAG: hypothetical protein LRS49_02620 [Desulfurococcales archaeon]|nr:hypothetical protein [Desulfurococcales archaeon]
MSSRDKKGKRRRMTLPKKKEDIEKIVEEVSETHAHEHEHHHHHHHGGEIDEILQVYEIFIDSLRANVNSLEAQLKSQRAELSRLYRVLAKIVEACFSGSEEDKARALSEAANILAAAE